MHKSTALVGKEYDKRYAENPHFYGLEPSGLVTAIMTSLPPRSLILDIGCGTGRNSLPLARRGHRVIGVDLSSVAITHFEQTAASEQLDVVGIVGDIFSCSRVLALRFDLIISSCMLHNLHYNDAVDLIGIVQRSTTPGGFHVIECLTRYGSHAASAALRGIDEGFLPDLGVLGELYDFWRKHMYEEAPVPSLAPEGDIVARLLAEHP
jgi:SAM-dependent methyltransferase